MCINPNAFGNALGASLAEVNSGLQRESATNVPKEFGLKPTDLRLNKPDGISDGITQYADGSSRLANGRLVRPSVTAVQIPTEPGYVPSDSQLVTNDGRISTTLDGGGIYRTATGEQLDGLTRHTSYAAIPVPYLRPTPSELDGHALWNGLSASPGQALDGVRQLMQGKFSEQGFVEGVYQMSPVGLLGAAADGRYDQVGERAGGMALGTVAGKMTAWGVNGLLHRLLQSQRHLLAVFHGYACRHRMSSVNIVLMASLT